MMDPSATAKLDLFGLFPDTVALVATSVPTALPLAREEELALGAAVERRRRDFTTGRACARAALATLGIHGVPIQRGADRQPLWPPGICGSITHCEGCWAAAAARRADAWSLGLDAERRQVISEGVLRRVALPSERDILSAAPGDIPWDVLLFSAKESVFKAWFPIARTWLGFEDVRVEFNYERQTFHAVVITLNCPGQWVPSVLRGRYLIEAGFVVTGVVVPPPQFCQFTRSDLIGSCKRACDSIFLLPGLLLAVIP